jgi:hypothetical protein
VLFPTYYTLEPEYIVIFTILEENMLLQVIENMEFETFRDLYTASIFLFQNANMAKKTMVIGPITAKDEEDVAHNLEMLHFHSNRLAKEGWAVLDLKSFQPAIDVLINRFNIKRYPHELLDDFTFPLIESGTLTAIHVLKNYPQSFGATLEHDKALGVGVPVIYIS